jgi:hypothetical protein
MKLLIHRSWAIALVVVLACSANLMSARAQFVGACRILPVNNWWNEDVSKLPVHPLSDLYVGKINGSRTALHPDWGSNPLYGIPYIVIPPTQPLVHLSYLVSYANEGDEIDMPIPPEAPVENGSPESNTGDRHVLVVDTAHHFLYELYNAHKDAADKNWQASVSVRFDLNSDSLRYDGYTSADAAGLPIFPGLVRYDEIKLGVINHAVRFTVPTTQRGWITPARHQAGKSDTTYPPMGLRMRLKANYDVSNFTAGPKVLLTALKKYGMILADNGSAWFISGASDARWDDNEWAPLKTVPGSAFEAVYTGKTKRAADQTPENPPSLGVLEQQRDASSVLENYPNPFADATSLSFSIDRPEHLSLVVRDVLGRVVSTLANGQYAAGEHVAQFSAGAFAAGVYFAELQTTHGVSIRRMQVVK